MMPPKLKRLLSFFLTPLYRWYFSKQRSYSYGDIRATILPGVFTPHLTFSTKILLDHLLGMSLEGRHFLELGSGCGIISVLAAKKSAVVTACDINPLAVKNTSMNANLNNVLVRPVLSDMFDALQGEKFDLIVINPPYYPRNPSNDAEKAWFCGEHFEYFEKLFSVLAAHINTEGEAIMILSEDCDIARIISMAEKKGLQVTEKQSRKNLWEKNHVFTIRFIW